MTWAVGLVHLAFSTIKGGKFLQCPRNPFRLNRVQTVVKYMYCMWKRVEKVHRSQELGIACVVSSDDSTKDPFFVIIGLPTAH